MENKIGRKSTVLRDFWGVAARVSKLHYKFARAVA